MKSNVAMLDFLRDWLIKSENSRFDLWLINQIFRFSIPFNSPHLRVSKVTYNSIEVTAPFKRHNKNHINGIHACAMQAISEFAGGLIFFRKFTPSRYRVIITDFSIHYILQGKSACRAIVKLDQADITEKITIPLQSQDSVLFELKNDVFDAENQLIAKCTATFQIKEWSKVKMDKVTTLKRMIKKA